MFNFKHRQYIYHKSQEEVPNDYQTIASCTNKLLIIGRESNACDAVWVSSALGDESSGGKIVYSNNSESPTSCKILIIWRNGDWHKLVALTLVGTALEEIFRVRLANVPVGNFSLLSNWYELVVIKRSNRKTVNSSHTLCLISYSFLLFQVPAEDRLVTCSCHQVHVVREDLDSSYFTWMFF